LTTPQGLAGINGEVTRQAATADDVDHAAAFPLIILLRTSAKRAAASEVPAAMD
jgi:hypothetical protein